MSGGLKLGVRGLDMLMGVDEVETLLPSRMKAIGGREPNDGIRVRTPARNGNGPADEDSWFIRL